MTIITVDQFAKMIPSNRDAASWRGIALELFAKYDIDTTNRIAGFMAQTGHESQDFRLLSENLNYSWQGLRKTFPGYFPTDALAQQYHRQPEKIANFVYDDRNPARRNKLHNTRNGDGWRFRGAGLIQLTGRFNFTQFGSSIGLSPEEAADYARTKKGAFESACWYWSSRNLNNAADADDIRRMTVIVNGGTIGLDDRTKRYVRNKSILLTETSVAIKIGSRGETVKEVQQVLKLVADGIFGPNTDRAVKSWQRTNQYIANGILTPNQLEKLLGESKT